jgi:hypothetical protein
MAKLTREKVLAIRGDARALGEIAAGYGINKSSVSLIKSRKSWAWLPETGASSRTQGQ